MMQAERFLTLSIAEVLGRVANAVMSEGVLTPEKKLEVAQAMTAAGQALGTKTLADLIGVSALALAPYTPPVAPAPAAEPSALAPAAPSEAGAGDASASGKAQASRVSDRK